MHLSPPFHPLKAVGSVKSALNPIRERRREGSSGEISPWRRTCPQNRFFIFFFSIAERRYERSRYGGGGGGWLCGAVQLNDRKTPSTCAHLSLTVAPTVRPRRDDGNDIVRKLITQLNTWRSRGSRGRGGERGWGVWGGGVKRSKGSTNQEEGK